MPSIAGEAAVRIVPSVRGFHSDVKRKLEQKRVDFDVNIGAKMGRAYAEAEAFRKAQESRDVKIRVVTDFAGLKRDLAQVEHVFKRNSMSKALRLNIVIAGLDLLPVLSYGAAGAAASIDTLARAALVLPGALGGALASVGTLATGLHGVKAAFTSFQQTQKKTAETARLIADDNRQLQRSYRDYGAAVRDTIRDIQDLNAENRRSSLNVADAILGVQEAADRLRQGGQKSITELQRDQLSYLQAVDRLQEVNTKAKRVAEDTATANAKGVQGADKVADALDQINKNIEKLNTDKLSKIDEAMAKLSPNAQAFVTATRGLKDEWTKLQNTVQDNLFRDLDKTIVTLANNTFPMLERGMGRVATSLNGSFKSLAAELGSAGNTNLMERIFGNTDVGLRRLSVGFKPFVDGMLRLTKESSDFLPRLGDAGAKVAQRFDNWVKRISDNGKLDKWISKSLDGFSSLGRSIGNLGGALSAFTDIFDTATGNQGGFLKTIENATARLKTFLESTKGRNELANYFRETKQFIGELGSAYKDIKPLIKDVVETAREWSLLLFNGVGAFAQMATAIEKHTGILKPLLTLYFGAKTVKPFWDILSTSYKNYERLVIAGANNSVLQKIPGMQTAANMAYAARGQVNPNAPVAQTAAAAAVAGAPAFTPGGPVNAKNVQQQAALRGIGTYSNPLLQYNYLVANGLMNAAGAVPAPTKSTYAPAPMYGPMQLPPEFPPNSKLSKKQRAAKAEALAAYREKASQFYDYAGNASLKGATQAAPAMGAMQGPALPPVDLDALGNKAKEATKSVDDLGKTSDAAKGKVDDLGKKASSAATASDNFGNKAKGAKPDTKGLGDAAGAAATKVDSVGTSAAKAATSTTDLGTAASKTAKGGLKDVADAAKSAGDDVGDDRIGLKGRLIGLASSIGIQAVIGAAIVGFTALINKLGQAHRDAAEAAKAQEDRLKGLAGTLDATTGGYTAQTYARAIEDSKAYTPGGGVKGTFNLPEIIARLGVNGEQLFKNALDPTKGQAFQQDMTGVYAQAKKQLVASPIWQDQGRVFEDWGLTADDVTKAALGDAASLQKFRDIRDNQAVTEGGQPILPDLGAVVNSMPNKDWYALGHYLNTSNQAVVMGGYNNITANMTMGRARLTPAGSTLFGAYSPNTNALLIDPATRNGVIQLNREPSKQTQDEWSSKGISVSTEGNGIWKVTIDPAEAGNYLERYADGGMVRGPGGPRSDSILARVSAGEHITNASAVQYYGPKLFHALNAMALPKFAPGGWPFPLKPMPDPHPDIVPAPAAPAPLPPPLPAEAGFTPPAGGTPGLIPPGATGAAPPAGGGTPFDITNPGLTPPGAVLTNLPPGMSGATGSAAPANAVAAAAKPPLIGPSTPGMLNPAAAYSVAAQLSTMKVPYQMGGFSTAGIDCSGLVSAVVNSYLGYAPFSERMNTVIEGDWLAKRGFVKGKGPAGSLRVGWFDRGGGANGHTAITLPDGTNVESRGGSPVLMGSGAASYDDPMFDQQMWLPSSLIQGITPGSPLGSLAQVLPDGTLLGGISPDLLTSGTVTGTPKTDPTTEFLQNIASSGGANLLSIGTSFLSGITGIDFGFLTGTAQRIGSAAIQAWGPKNTTDGQQANPAAGALDSILPGLSGLFGGGGAAPAGGPGNAAVGSLLNGMVAGQLPLQSPNVQNTLGSTGFNQNLDGTGTPSAEWSPVTDADIAAAVDQIGPMLGITNKSAWVSALSRSASSKGKPFENAQGTGVQRAMAALMNAYRDWGVDPTTGGPQTPGYAMGGSAAGGLAWLSNGEFRTNPRATAYYGAGLFNALNAKAIPKSAIKGFATGGWPLIPDPLLTPPPAGGQAAGPLPMTPQPAPPPLAPDANPVPDISVGAQQDSVPVPSTGGEPGPGATAPAPDPGSLPGVADALAGIGGGLAQPGADPGNQSDPRGTLGSAPASQEHTNPAISGMISGAASAIGSIASLAAKGAIAGGTMGGGAALAMAPGVSQGMDAGIQAGAQMAGAVVNGAVNILSSLLVGTATNGSTASASGIPLLPQRQSMQTGVPAMGQAYQDNRTYNITNLDEYRRLQERDAAQAANPFIGKF